MVTSGTSLRSMRPRRSVARTFGRQALASARISSGEHVRHLVLAHRDLDLHAGVVDLAQHLDDAAHRLRVARRLL